MHWRRKKGNGSVQDKNRDRLKKPTFALLVHASFELVFLLSLFSVFLFVASVWLCSLFLSLPACFFLPFPVEQGGPVSEQEARALIMQILDGRK